MCGKIGLQVGGVGPGEGLLLQHAMFVDTELANV
jgi:hypothetical protein